VVATITFQHLDQLGGNISRRYGIRTNYGILGDKHLGVLTALDSASKKLALIGDHQRPLNEHVFAKK
jgi:hypothetical protein